MASRRYTVNEVVDELDVSDFKHSEDDFDGYLDIDSDTETNRNYREDDTEEREEERGGRD